MCLIGTVRPMWVVLVSTGLRGDIEPFVHLASGLEKKGHRVTLAVNAVHGPHVQSLLGEGSSVELVELRGDLEAKRREKAWHGYVASRSVFSPLAAASQWSAKEDYAANASTLLLRLTEDGDAGVLPSVLVAHTNMYLTSVPLAEGLCIPLVHVSLLPPPLPCTAYPPPLWRPRPLPLGILNLFVGWWAQDTSAVLSSRYLLHDVETHQDESGAPRLDMHQLQVRLHALPTALAYPTLLFPPPKVWEGRPIHCCGALLDSSPPLDPTRDPRAWSLQSFIDAVPDEKPVLISFGSLQGVREDLARLAIGALYATHRRGILVRGWAEVSSSQLDSTDPEEVQLLAYARQRVYELEGPLPYSWVLPRCVAIIHHGGAGTTAAALHAGVPQIVLPAIEDQSFWGLRVAEVGVSCPIQYFGQEVSVDTLAGMISTVVSDEVVARAKEVAEEARKEDGLRAVIRVVEGEAAKGGGGFWDEVYRRVDRENRWKVFRARVVVVSIIAGIGTVAYFTVKRLTRRSGGR